MSGRRILILGAGVCGLATALRTLQREPDAHVVVLEMEDTVGGLARSLTLRGQVADFGPHRIHTELPDVQEFLQELAGPDLVRVPRRSRMWLDGRWVEYPPKPLEMLRAWGSLRLARVLASFAAQKLRRANGDRVDSYDAVMTDAFGSELYKLIARGYTRKVWKVDPSEIHGDIARVRVSAGGLDRILKRVLVGEKEGQETALKRFYYLPGGVAGLADRLRARVEALGGHIHTGCQVRNLTAQPDGRWRVDSRRNDDVLFHLDADLVISTLPVTDLLAMLLPQRPDDAVAQAHSEMRFIANFLVLVAVNRPRVSDSQWLYFPGEDTLFNRGYEPKNFDPGMGEPQTSLLVLETTCHEGDAIWNSSDAELTERTLADLDHIGLVRRGEVLDTMVHRIPHTYPLYDLGYRERLETVWSYLSQWQNLLSVGRQGLFLHNNMDHSIHMGFRAAEAATGEHRQEPQRHFYQDVRRFQAFRIVD